MKLLLALILTLSTAFLVHAQNFEVINENSVFKGNIGDKIVAPIKIKNLSDAPLNIGIRRIEKVIGSSQNNYFCLGAECFGSQSEQLPQAYTIDPGEVSLEFSSILDAGLVSGYSVVKFLIYNKDNPGDAITYELSYIVEDKSPEHLIYNSEEVKINDVYPNPVGDVAIFDYNIVDHDIDAKLIIHNVLGSIVANYSLNYLNNELKIKTHNFNPGVYFYTLYVDDDAVITRKLIVRK